MDDLFGCTLNKHCYLVNKTRTPCGKILCPLEDEAAEENPLTPELTCRDCQVLKHGPVDGDGGYCLFSGDVECRNVNTKTAACVRLVADEETYKTLEDPRAVMTAIPATCVGMTRATPE